MRGQQLRIHLLDLAILLYHIHRGAKREDVGFEDCERTIQELTAEIASRRALVDQSALESALWSANLMDEVGEFWSPYGDGSFDSFVQGMLRHAYRDETLTFDRIYNQIKMKKQVAPK